MKPDAGRPDHPTPPLPKKLLAVITGPTASGKTAWALALARRFGTEIVSADARQFYRELNAGTAKPTAAQRAAAPHHFIDTLSIAGPYNAGRYEADCLALLDVLFARHDVVILCGGSGLYINAVLYGFDRLPPADATLRRSLAARPLESLRAQLAALDPDYCANADLQNPQRVRRALEVCLLTGKPYSQLRSGRRAARPFAVHIAALDPDRKALYEAIDRRVDDMLSAGLVEEARALLPRRRLEALRTIGYTELFRHFDGELSLEQAVSLIRKNSRNYAKRQLTWLRSMDDVHWYKPQAFNDLERIIETRLEAGAWPEPGLARSRYHRNSKF
jgi:tRNA dimethylallyltransferase